MDTKASLLQLPLFKTLEGKKSILLAGAGGGFDVFSGIPLYFALKVRFLFCAKITHSLTGSRCSSTFGQHIFFALGDHDW